MKRWIMVLVALLLLTACGTTTKPCALIREHGGVHDRVPVSSLPQRPGNPDLQYLQTAAALSAAVYVDVKHEIKLADVDPATLAKPEQSKNLALLPASGWEERTDIPRTQIPGKRQTPDLTYRLWVSTDTTKPRVAMWVFRGTHIPQDYISNLRWLTFWLGYEDHYQQTTRITEEMVKWIHREYGDDTVIFTAGHSLGGGLAQTAAYKACGQIRTVFAFDPTPVTHHTARNGCPSSPKNFYRVFEQSEILSYLRFLFRKVLGLKAHDPHIMEVKVHLFNGIFVKGHSMQQLASELAKGLNSTEPVTCSKD
ncbi:MAG: hypothetical protein DMF56_12890 [Acidobacteria bacterium]|nr:MAG: hypothetical protein DMF56_12890 [Acidobacteriota bacterium]